MRPMTSKGTFNTKKPDFCDCKTGILETGNRFTVTNLIFEGQWWTCVHVSYKYIKVRPKSSRKIRRLQVGRARKKVQQKNTSKSTWDPQGRYGEERSINKGKLMGPGYEELYCEILSFACCFAVIEITSTTKVLPINWPCWTETVPLGNLTYYWQEFSSLRSVCKAI